MTTNAGDHIQGRRFWTACSDGDLELVTAIMNGKPGLSVINFAMQKKIHGTPLDAAIHFKKDSVVYYLKNLERFPEFKLDYYTEKKNQSSPEYAAYQKLLGLEQPVIVSVDKPKFQTKEEIIMELKQSLVAKDQTILDQKVKIEELEKEVESLKSRSSSQSSGSKYGYGGNSSSTSSQNDKGPHNFASLRKGSTGPANNIARGDPPKFGVNSGSNDDDNKPNMFGALRKTTGPRPSNEQPGSGVVEEESKPNPFVLLKKTAGPKLASEQPPENEEKEPQVFFQLRKSPRSPRTEVIGETTQAEST